MTSLLDLPYEIIEDIGKYIGPTACLLNMVCSKFRGLFPICSEKYIHAVNFEVDNPELYRFIQKNFTYNHDRRLYFDHNCIRTVKYMIENVPHITDCHDVLAQAVAVAAFHGDFDMVQNLMVQYSKTILYYSSYAHQIPEKACKGGHLKVVEYLIQYTAFNFNSHLHCCIENDHLDCFLSICRYRVTVWDSVKFILIAARRGSLKCLEYLITCHSGYTCNPVDILANAARSGSLECLRYVHLHYFDGINDRIVIEAIKSGSIECLEYLMTHFGWNEKLLPLLCRHAVAVESFGCLRYLVENSPRPIDLDIDCCYLAAKKRTTLYLDYVRKCGCKWDQKAYEYANDYKSMICFEYLHKNGCPYDAKTLGIELRRIDCFDTDIYSYFKKYM